MKGKKETFKQFEERVRHKEDSLFSILFIIPITVRIAYLIKKIGWNLDPNKITFIRLFVIFPIMILLLFLAPILRTGELYLVNAILIYLFLLTDWLDGQIARGQNKSSKKGAFLDSIADRTAIIIFITSIISVGLWLEDWFIIFGGILIFVLKTLHMMIITKIFYYRTDVDSSNEKTMINIFGGGGSLKLIGVPQMTLLVDKFNKKYLKIKRWNPDVVNPERYMLTIALPLLLLFLGFNNFVMYLEYFFVVLFNLFFIVRIRNLLKDYLK